MSIRLRESTEGLPKIEEVKSDIYNRQFSLSWDGNYSLGGIVMGVLTIQKQDGEKIVIKEAGHQGWYSRGETKYYNPSFLIGYLKNGKFEAKYQITYDQKTRKEALKHVELLLEAL